MARADANPLPPQGSKAAAVEVMFDRIAGRYDTLNRLLTLGLDTRWRRRTVAELQLARGATVADLACGTGDLCRELERAGYRPTGYDFAAAMLAVAARRTRAPLVRADILALPLGDAEVDGATCGFALRNVADLGGCFAEMARVVRAGGRIAILEVGEPSHPAARRLHALYFRRLVPAIGGLLSDRAAYRYLPASTSYLPPDDVLLGMLRGAGFPDARRITLGAGAAQLLVGTRA